MTKNLLQCPLNLKFNCDWDRVRKIYHRINQLREQHRFNKTYEPTYQSEVYSLGKQGSMITDHNLTDSEWNIWTGKLLEQVLPPEVLNISSELLTANLKFINFGYFIHHGPIKKHVDGQKLDDTDNGHCNINYIVSSTDTNARTHLVDSVSGEHESYPSIVGKAWLLDSASMHWVENTGTREIFQIKVFSSFYKVKNFLQEKGWTE
jgi:hypothetical protein